MLRFITFAVWVYIFLTPIAVNAALLPVDKAFSLAVEVQENKLILRWNIAKGYYLYKDKISVATDSGLPIGKLLFPKAIIKQDEFFGRVGVYRDELIITAPLEGVLGKRLNLVIGYQGCADIGVCYPPIRKTIPVEVPQQQPENNTSNDQKTTGVVAKTGQPALSLGKSLKDGIFGKFGGYSDEEPLPPHKAFDFSITQKDPKTLTASWLIQPKYYLYKNKFNFKIEGARQGQLIFPKAKTKSDPFFGDVEVYYGQVDIDIPLKDITNNNIKIVAAYQGCWEGGVCYPPQQNTKNLVLNTPIQQSDQQLAKPDTSQGQQVSQQAVDTELSSEQKITHLLKNQNALWVLLSFFGLGLLLSLTPCVFPMIPILSGIIVGQKNKHSTKGNLLISIVFVLAVAFVYAIAGVIAGYFGQNLQAALQAPWVLITFSLVFVALALSMFGLYDLELPKAIQSRLDKIQNKQRSGLLGVAIMGALSALIIGPCVAPPLAGALIYIGQTGDMVLGGLSLFVMGLGMGVPLIIIGASAGKLLPKSGVWMDKVKMVFGILMLGVAIYLLERIVSEVVLLMLWGGLLTLSMAAMGVLKPLSSNASALGGVFKALGLIVFAYGVLLLLLVARGGGDMSTPLSGWGGSNSAQGQPTQSIEFQPVKSISELETILKKSEQQGKTVMLDFYADWCITCKIMEKYVFNDPAVYLVLSDFVLIQADVTQNNAQDKALMKRFGVVGPPSILFFKQGQELRSKRIVGEVGKRVFLTHLKQL